MFNINLSIHNKSDWFKAAIVLLGIAAFIYCLLGPLPQSFTAEMGREAMLALGILLLAISLWITDFMHNAFSGFFCCAVLYMAGRFMNSGVLRESSFSGFGEYGVWFVFSGLIIGCGMLQSGLSHRLYLKMLTLAKNTYASITLMILLVCSAMLFLVPSTDARTIIILSLVMGLGGLSSSSSGNPLRGISLMIPISTSILGIGALASISAITAAGYIEKYMGISISYMQWFIYLLPAVAITMVVLYLLVLRIFPCEIKGSDLRAAARAELAGLGKLNNKERKAVIIIGIAILFWFSGFATGIRPDIVTMMAASAMLMPGIGFLTKKDISQKLNWLIAPLFLGCAFSLVNAMTETGMLDYIGNHLFESAFGNIAGMSTWGVMMIICAISAILHIFSAHSSVLVASFMPVVLAWTSAHGFGAFVPLIFIWGVEIQFMIYQSGAITAAYGYGHFSSLDCLKLSLPLGLFQLLGGTTILYFWWKLLGLV